MNSRILFLLSLSLLLTQEAFSKDAEICTINFKSIDVESRVYRVFEKLHIDLKPSGLNNEYRFKSLLAENHFGKLKFNIQDSCLCLSINSFNRIEKSRSRIDTINNYPMNAKILEGISQEITGKTFGEYESYSKYPSTTLAYVLTFIEPSIGYFYLYNSGIGRMAPKLKWFFSFGNLLLFSLPSYSLLFSDNPKLRKIGIAGVLFDRLFLGTIVVHFTMKENKIYMRSGYKYNFRELDAIGK